MTAFDPKGWEWWQAALELADAGKASLIGSDQLPIYDEPMTGFWRVRTHKGGPFIPIRTWYAGGELKGMKNGAAAEPVSIMGLWSYCASNPISYDNYTAFMESKKDPATPNGIWFDETVVTVGEKVMSSHVAEPKAEEPAPAKRGRGRPRKNPATVEEPKAAPVDEKPVEEADVRTEEQKGAYHINGEPMWAKDGTLLDDKGNRSIFDDVDAHGDDEPEVDEWGDPIVKPAVATPAPVAAPVERFWLNTAKGSLFTSEKDYSGEPNLKELTEERFKELVEQNREAKARQAAKAAAEAAATAQTDDAQPENERAVIGNNSAGEFEQLVDEVGEWSRIVKKMQESGPAKNQVEADKVSDARTKLGDLWKALEAMRKVEKKPHDDAAKAVQEKFVPLLRRAEIAGDATNVLLKPFLDEQNRIERERVAEINRKAKEEAEKAKKDAEEFGEEAPDVVVREVKAQNIGAGNRRKVSTVKRQVAVVEDAKLAAAYFASMEPPHQDLVDTLRKLGHRVLTSGVPVPGMKLATEESIR